MGDPRTLTPRQRERRERILQTVRDQLSTGGYDGISMRELAVSAHVSPTTLYNLYDSKDALILAALQDLLAQLADEVAATESKGFKRLLAGADAVAKQIVATPRYAEAMTRLMFNASGADPISKILLDNNLAAHRQSLREMQKLGEARADIDIDLFARTLATARWAIIFQWLKGYISLEDLRHEYARGVILALLPAMTPKLNREYRSILLERTLTAAATYDQIQQVTSNK